MLRAVYVVCAVTVLAGCAGFDQRCQSLGLDGKSSSFARCVHERHLALETTLFTIANGFSAR
jgi:hypothetical protein